ncbi:DNA-binding MarR family transcriptional regulator [Rhizobium aquaticum]|uniref:DNA-binding MarR family transcriptional regulator n=1 Tax=Rhizobium aquaticum TaxID=1549636 RepID=A0ABV2IUI6_9HYPH
MSNLETLPHATTLHVRDHCLCLHAQRAARALARRFDRAFRHLGINNGQFSLLISLNRPEPPAMSPVAELLAMDRTTLTAVLKPLTRRGLVEIVAGEKDRREKRLKLTPAGLALLAEATPIWIAEHADVETRLPQGDVDRLRQDLLIISKEV